MSISSLFTHTPFSLITYCTCSLADLRGSNKVGPVEEVGKLFVSDLVEGGHQRYPTLLHLLTTVCV